ncbi:hypothetical protein NW762_008262 [Fusarium torreyae]|uniref:Uncharacterized protein n=1 Tax=Fusarium torreyae TaxID=1237075 RepID=A0A9W8RYK6_9HYPO|nr:hypothetical protein NW762_008262 [Fusarium torreyae]
MNLAYESSMPEGLARLMSERKQPSVETLPEVETAIMCIKEEHRELTFCMVHSDYQLQRLRQKRKFLRTKALEAQGESDNKDEHSFLDSASTS